MEKILSGTEKLVAAKLVEMGYTTENHGSSCFMSRRSISVFSKEGQDEQSLEADIERARKEVVKDKQKAFDEYFAKESADSQKVYAVVRTGYDYALTRERDPEKYDVVASRICAYTQDYRDGRDHTYQELMIDKEAMKKDKRREITLYVPKDLIGHVVGKGGTNIKNLGQKYGKFFKVKPDPREQYQEKMSALSQLYRDVASCNVDEFKGKLFQLSAFDTSWLKEEDKKHFQEEYGEKISNRMDNFEQEKKQHDLKMRDQAFSEFSSSLTSVLPELKNEEIGEKVAEFIEEKNSGFAIPYDEKEIVQLQNRLQQTKSDIREDAVKATLEHLSQGLTLGISAQDIEKMIADRPDKTWVEGYGEVQFSLNPEETKQVTGSLSLQKIKQEKEAVAKFVNEVDEQIEEQERQVGRCLTDAEVGVHLTALQDRIREENPRLEFLMPSVQNEVVKQQKVARIQRQKDIEYLRKSYYRCIAEEITNVRGEVHRAAGESKNSFSRLYSALHDSNQGIKNWSDINITPSEPEQDESILSHNVHYMEEHCVCPDIDANGGYYDKRYCYYRASRMVENPTENKPNRVRPIMQNEQTEVKQPVVHTDKKGRKSSNDFAALSAMLNGGNSNG
jgi:hypothetical protein